MKLLYEFGVIMAVTFLGEICHAVLPFPIPGQHLRSSSDAFCIVYEDYQTGTGEGGRRFPLDIMPPCSFLRALAF